MVLAEGNRRVRCWVLPSEWMLGFNEARRERKRFFHSNFIKHLSVSHCKWWEHFLMGNYINWEESLIHRWCTFSFLLLDFFSVLSFNILPSWPVKEPQLHFPSSYFFLVHVTQIIAECSSIMCATQPYIMLLIWSVGSGVRVDLLWVH